MMQDPNNEEFKVTNISTLLKQAISESASKIKVALPPRGQMLTNNISVEGESQVVPIPWNAVERKKTLRNSIVVGELFNHTFVLPDYIDIDKIEVPQMERTTSQVHQFSFKERLQGWNIERRQRPSGMCDMYYHHPKSKRKFRSIIEVVNFLLYEIYPDDRKKENKDGFKRNLNKNIRADGSSSKRKKEPTSNDKEMEKKRVEKFLMDAWNNLLKHVPKKPLCETEIVFESDQKEGYLLDDTDYKELEKQTSKEKIESWCNELINLINFKKVGQEAEVINESMEAEQNATRRQSDSDT